MADKMAAGPERLVKCRRLDELVYRINAKGSPQKTPPRSSAQARHDTKPPGPPPLQDVPLDLSLKTDTLRRKSAAAAASGRRSQTSAVVPDAQRQSAQGLAAQRQVSQGQAVQGQAVQGQAVQRQAAPLRAAQRQAVQGQVARRQAALRQAAQGQVALRQAALHPPTPIDAIIEQTLCVSDYTYACIVCGKMISLHDQLM